MGCFFLEGDNRRLRSDVKRPVAGRNIDLLHTAASPD